VFIFRVEIFRIKSQKQKGLPLKYKDITIDVGYRLDLLVEDKIVVESKSVEDLIDVHFNQVLTYLKLSKCKVGLLININVKSLKYGFKNLSLTFLLLSDLN